MAATPQGDLGKRAWEVARAAWNAGFRGDNLVTAIAVALAESGGRPYALNTNPDGSKDRGPWQINDRAHPDVSTAEAFGYNTSAQAAFNISKRGTDWSPWVAFTNGAYRRQLTQARSVAARAERTKPEPASGGGLPDTGVDDLLDVPGVDVPNPLDAVTGWVGDLTGWVERKAVLSLAYLLLGGGSLALILLGLRSTTGVGARQILVLARPRTGSGEIPF